MTSRHLIQIAGALLLLAAAAALALPTPASALVSTGDGTWQWQNPLPQGNDLNDVCTTPQGRIWSVGALGTIITSTDNGLSWTGCITETKADLLGVAGTGASAWAIAADGTIVRTSDGGATWVTQTSPATTALKAVDCASTLDCWIVGSAGLVLHTTDGGSTWARRALGTVDDLISVDFTDPDNGWIAGVGGVMLHTTDGGSTWSLPQWWVAPGIDWEEDLVGRDVIALSFIDADTGFALVRSDWDIYFAVTTRDGGASWRTSAGWSHIVDVAMTDRDHAWLIVRSWRYPGGYYGLIRGTTDGGITWTTDRYTAAGSTSLTSTATGDALAVGRDGYVSGVTAMRIGVWGWSPRLTDVAFADTSTGWAVGTYADEMGSYGVLARTSDGGATWRANEGGLETPRPRRIACLGKEHIWVVGEFDYTINNLDFSHDGGQTWSHRYIAGNAADVDFVSPACGWIVGNGGAVWSSTDGGSSWLEPTVVAGVQAFAAVDFVNEVRGWAVGTAGSIASTSDGGRTWALQNSPSSACWSDVCFRDADCGWIVGAAGAAAVTRDGGATWTAVSTGVTSDLAAVRFNGAAVCIVGPAGVAACSWDEGATWKTSDIGASGMASGLAVVDGRSWIVGGRQSILTSTTFGVDDTPPTVAAPRSLLARYGRPASLGVTVDDAEPSCGSVTVTASGIRTSRRGAWKATATTAPGDTVELALPEGLARGAYRVTLSARDAAGNISETPVMVLVVVR